MGLDMIQSDKHSHKAQRLAARRERRFFAGDAATAAAAASLAKRCFVLCISKHRKEHALSWLFSLHCQQQSTAPALDVQQHL
jgi:hypothetical protein